MKTGMENHSVQMEYTSALAKARRVLKAAGFPSRKTVGRYSPFGGTQRTIHGVNVHRIGCSESIALEVSVPNDNGSDRGRDARIALKALALGTLRANGMPFDDRGWLACGRDAR